MTTILRRLRAALMLTLIFVWDLITASLAVARIVLARRIVTRPGIIVVPVALRQPWAVALYAYFTSLTPGSTCLHVSEDRRQLYVHILDLTNPEATITRVDRHYGRWIAELEG